MLRNAYLVTYLYLKLVLDFSKVTEVPSRKENLDILERKISVLPSTKIHHRSENGQDMDMAIAGKLVLIGHKMPPTHNPQVLVCRLSAKRYFFTNCGFSGYGEAISGPWAYEPLLKKPGNIRNIRSDAESGSWEERPCFKPWTNFII